MNNATSLSNILFLSVYQYITTFSIFFTNIDLMTVDQQNQTVPVINALFQYLNKSTNESEAKYQLLLRVLKEFNTTEKNLTLDMEYVNETYQYIFNESLFHHCGNSNLFEIINEGNGNFKSLQDIVPHLSDCSANDGSTKLTQLAIDKLLKDYIGPIHEKTRNSSDASKIRMGILKRVKKQLPTPVSYNEMAEKGYTMDKEVEVINVDDDDDRDRQSPLSFKQYASNLIKEQNSKQFDLSEEIMDLVNFVNDDDLTNLSETFRKNLHYSGILKTKSNETMDADDNIGMIRFLSSSEQLESGENSPLGCDDIPGTSKQAKLRLDTSKNEIFESGRNGKSKRMQAIEKAAHLMSSCMANTTFEDLVYILKGYLFKLYENASPVPSYDQFARNSCNNRSLFKKYDCWKIPRHKFIDDVLYETNFNYKTKGHPLKKKFYSLFKNCPSLFKMSYEEYENSPLLHKSLRVEDFIILKHNLHSHQKRFRTIARQRLKASIYRLALREAEEDWMDNEIVLYSVAFDSNVFKIKRNLFLEHFYTFRDLTLFDTTLTEIEIKLKNRLPSLPQPTLFTLEMSNQVGIVNIDRLFENNSAGTYAIPTNMSFKVIKQKFIKIGMRNTFSMTMEDNRSKEKKIIFMVNELYSLFQNTKKGVFDYYN